MFACFKATGKRERKGILTEMGSVEDGMLQTEEEEAVLIKNQSETPSMKTYEKNIVQEDQLSWLHIYVIYIWNQKSTLHRAKQMGWTLTFNLRQGPKS